MEQICDPTNLNDAYKKVKANKGAAGVDRQTIEQTLIHVRSHKEQIIGSLLDGSYQPNLIRGVQILKALKADGISKRHSRVSTVSIFAAI